MTDIVSGDPRAYDERRDKTVSCWYYGPKVSGLGKWRSIAFEQHLFGFASISSSTFDPLEDMPKASKSSASAGTRKKQAKKAGDDEEEAAAPQNRPQRGQKKLSKAQKKALPKVKQYIPPRKPPAPPIPDPLDGQGLARTLPAELVVVLRRLGKKDDVTRRKGLDELREDWVGQLLRPAGADEDEVERELKETALVTAVPAVWVSHGPSYRYNSEASSCTILPACCNPPLTAPQLCNSTMTSYPPPLSVRPSSILCPSPSSQVLKIETSSDLGW